MDMSNLDHLAPLLQVAAAGAVLASGPLAWIWLRHRGANAPSRLRALTLLTLFLTFDLVLFGAFTRLSDSGLGCPDWPGCYGNASPLGAQAQIDVAETALPSGPVTHRKAWVEMTHRYLASGVGVLIVVLALASWLERRRDRTAAVSPWWATATLVWVCVQGAFGALTVTMKLYPAIVTAHLLGGMTLLALLAAQAQAHRQGTLRVPPALRRGVLVVCALAALQIALGGWVSTNYAVLACSDFPTCQGNWWPAMDLEQGFALRRELGRTSDGAWLPFAALTAIHYVHRLFAYLLIAALCLLAWRLHRVSGRAGLGRLRPWAWSFVGVAAWQLASGLSNVILGWPLAAALAHTAGAALIVILMTILVVRMHEGRRSVASRRAFAVTARTTP